MYRYSLRVFKQRKPSLTNEWKNKLPDFVLRLEEAVYRGARSQVRGLLLATLDDTFVPGFVHITRICAFGRVFIDTLSVVLTVIDAFFNVRRRNIAIRLRSKRVCKPSLGL